mgnify:CR=1 FL=1
MLTNKQNQLLNFLILRIEQDGVSPSYEEICLELNLKSKSGIHRIVKALEERGYIEHLENKARAIAPIKYPNGQPYISNVIDINKLLNCGADKVSINTAAVQNPEVVVESSKKFGSQCIVVNQIF